MAKDEQETVQKLERELRKAETTGAVKLVEAKADALAKLQKLKK